MKKYLTLILLVVTLSGFSQKKYSESFDVKNYAKQQTEMIQSALELNQATAEKVYQTNLNKARSLHKYLILAEKNKQTDGKSLKQVLKMINNDAERGSGYQNSMKHILGEERYAIFLEKFSK
jgi:hypothetical protein